MVSLLLLGRLLRLSRASLRLSSTTTSWATRFGGIERGVTWAAPWVAVAPGGPATSPRLRLRRIEQSVTFGQASDIVLESVTAAMAP